MNNCSKTILHLLSDSAGYDINSPHAQRLAKKLSQNQTLQHYANGLEMELFQALEQTGSKMLRRSRKKNMISRKAVLKKRQSAQLPVLEVKMRVPNLTVGKAFKEAIIPLDNLSGSLEFCNAMGHEEITGLSLNDADFMIEGSIDQAGDYEVKLYCLLLLPNGEKQKVLGTLKITVIADPRSLWKNLSSDTSARFHKPDSHADSCENDSVKIIASSVRGRSHAHKGTHRDDDFKLSCSSSSDWNVICVADGAGSCKYSRRGAEIASLRSTRTLRETLNGHYGENIAKAYDDYIADKSETNGRKLQEIFQHTIVKAVHDAARAIHEEVNKEEGDRFKDFSTTLLLAAHKPINDGHLILSFWIGDGAAVIYDKGKAVRLLGEPDSGEFAGQTRFLDNKIFADGGVYNRVTITTVESMTALILATDGITDARFETEKQLAAIEPWDDLWSELEPIIKCSDLKKGQTDLTQWMDFWSPGNHDDRTIAICWVKE
ncbi:MAG: PP2C family serine/threonine-protein phosphatase [Gammaproteobacteria bacterium]|nr:PP2C family serine/threonine-protein phosphatase [Gammaproteobacteria bacterium]